MSTYNKRTARRFQLEALETRWTPSGASVGALLDGMAPCGGRGGMGGDIPHIQLNGDRVGGTWGITNIGV